MSSLDPAPDGEFIAAFLDDYFAECEEHFAIIRRSLLALEEGAGDASREATLLEELFRNFHSLKGISAMVDGREAERVSHELESVLRRLRARELALTPAAITALIEGTAGLEAIVAARRSGDAGPSADAVVQALTALVSSPTDVASSVPKAARPDVPGSGRWRFTFSPSAQLVERGVKVDSIRARLSAIGEITSVTPRVVAGDGIVFDFNVTGPADAGAFESWQADGLAWEPRADPDQAAPAAAPADKTPRASAQSDHGILAPSHFVRVDLKRLDDLMRRVADLVVTRARIEEILARVEGAIPPREWRTLQETSQTFERQLRDLREDVMRVRLVRIDEIFRRMPFVARDVAREAQKDVRVVLNGQNTEIDKFLVERMMDPLLHLVRNAVSHGIESPEQRLAAGKPAAGTVTLTASTAGELVMVEIADDGAGIDERAVAERARAPGLRVPEGELDSATLIDLICEPGFSTRDEADRSSGRGMGLSVVRTTVQELGGTLRAENQRGVGTRFIIGLPLTLAITDALIAVSQGHTFAVPQSSVQEVIEVRTADVRQLEHNELIAYRGRSLPFLRLGRLLGLREEYADRMHAFVIGSGQEMVAVAVDRILGQREIVVRTMTDSLLKIEGLSGATELGDGRVVLIVDAPALTRWARSSRGGNPQRPDAPARVSATRAAV